MKNINIMLKHSLIYLPSPSNISIWWNFGFMLGMTLMAQIITGLFLSLHYSSFSKISFLSIHHIIRDVNYGWMFQIIHTNGASLFFVLIYIHIARGIYFSSYKMLFTWISGFMILILLMLSAFLGYVLPWGQMSFWGATVITNLLSAFPYIGNSLVFWIWGGFSIDNATLSRFFIFHFLFPMIIILLAFFHLLFLHETGSNNPLGSNSNFDKIPFTVYFMFKDILSFMIAISSLSIVIFFFPMFLLDPENFSPANPMTTPIHIQPEWYFLFAYAILRSIPNKLGGVIALIMSLFMLLFLPFSQQNFMSNCFSYKKYFFWIFLILFFILTFIGSKPVEDPFIMIGQIVSILYFLIYLFI